MMLVLAGVFAGDADPAYGGTNGTDYYVASYLPVPMAAVALIGLPTALASYRELGIIRRFEASGLSLLNVVGAQAFVTAVLVVLGAALVLLAAGPIYGIPAVVDLAGVIVCFLLGMVTMLSLGVAFGLAARTARSAQALGLLAFMPMWLLGGGGPPPAVMTDVMQRVSDVLPMSHVTAAVRNAWLDTGDVGGHVLAVSLWLGLGLTACAWLLRRRPDRP
ncbi:ABC transporter permease [Intrasporangium sp.]|uniref:ABC transporter permease n=1 Tax=Intrasporangium sp. TaxID=1925024 RepID=UPI00293A9A69|nr:ABC transporter permease [Intrasporangium sp.]MDV3223295.1 ABC transporter permease [Intrasporangium sp.]